MQGILRVVHPHSSSLLHLGRDPLIRASSFLEGFVNSAGLCPIRFSDTRLPQVALKGVLYGGKQRIDVQRLQRLAAGFTQFTVDGLAAEPVLLPATNVRPTP